MYSEIDRIKSLADKNFGSAGVDENDNEEDEDEDEDEGEYNEDNLPDLAALSMEDVEKTGDCPKVCVYAADPSTIPDRCCPRPQSVSVSDYQHNKERSMSVEKSDVRELRLMTLPPNTKATSPPICSSEQFSAKPVLEYS